MAVAILSCGMDMPKPNQIKAYLELNTADAYKDVRRYEEELFENMIAKVSLKIFTNQLMDGSLIPFLHFVVQNLHNFE